MKRRSFVKWLGAVFALPVLVKAGAKEELTFHPDSFSFKCDDIETIADLRKLPHPADNDVVTVKGAFVPGDGGGGIFRFEKMGQVEFNQIMEAREKLNSAKTPKTGRSLWTPKGIISN